MNVLLIALALSAPPVTLPKQPAQVALPACACKPCHCEDCACAGGICACAGCGLSLEAGAALAARQRLPLVVWVGGHTHASVEKRLPPAVHVRVDAWKGDKTPGVLVCPIHQGWPHARGLIPAAQADLATVLAEMAGDWLRVPVRTSPLYFAPSAGRQC